MVVDYERRGKRDHYLVALNHEITRARIVAAALLKAWHRLAEMHEHPGRWGKFLACVITAAWAVGFALDAPSTRQWLAAKALTNALDGYAAAWLFFVAGFPIVAVAADSMIMRLLSTTTLLGTWLGVFIEALIHWDGYRPAWGSVLVAVLGSLNADARLVRSWLARTRDDGS